MSSSHDRVRVAEEQLAILAEGAYAHPSGSRVELRVAIDSAVERTRLFREDTLLAFVDESARDHVTGDLHIECVRQRGGECAKRLLDDGARRVALLNYANGIAPGGGFLHGARAQEESLCRMSALYACLSSNNPDAMAFYDENRARASALVSGHVLASEDVPFFRDEELALLDRPHVVTVLTAAAPDLGWLHATTSEGLEPRSLFDEIPLVFARRTCAVLEAAKAVGCDALVVGPWGCGAFGNDPEVVAEAFSNAITRCGAGLSRIVFSTWGPDANRVAFERRFS